MWLIVIRLLLLSMAAVIQPRPRQADLIRRSPTGNGPSDPTKGQADSAPQPMVYAPRKPTLCNKDARWRGRRCAGQPRSRRQWYDVCEWFDPYASFHHEPTRKDPSQFAGAMLRPGQTAEWGWCAEGYECGESVLPGKIYSTVVCDKYAADARERAKLKARLESQQVRQQLDQEWDKLFGVDGQISSVVAELQLGTGPRRTPAEIAAAFARSAGVDPSTQNTQPPSQRGEATSEAELSGRSRGRKRQRTETECQIMTQPADHAPQAAGAPSSEVDSSGSREASVCEIAMDQPGTSSSDPSSPSAIGGSIQLVVEADESLDELYETMLRETDIIIPPSWSWSWSSYSKPP